MMLISVSVLLLLFIHATTQDSLEDDFSTFEDLTDEPGVQHRLVGPLPPLPDMTSLHRGVPGPPGITPPPGFDDDLDTHEEFGIVSAHGKTRIMGVSRRKPDVHTPINEELE